MNIQLWLLDDFWSGWYAIVPPHPLHFQLQFEALGNNAFVERFFSLFLGIQSRQMLFIPK